MPYLRNKRTGETIWVEGGAPTQRTIGTPDPTKIAGVRQAQNKAVASDYDPESARLDNELKRLQIAEAQRKIAEASKPPAAELSPGQEALDRAFAKEYADWVNAGGSATAQRQIETLSDQANKLENSDTISGGFIGRMPDAVRQLVNPDSINVQDKVEQTVQSALRQVLGGQFTQQEADRFLARSYNPKVDEKDNVKRLRSASDELRDKAWSKGDSARYFETTGSLAGHRPVPRPKTLGDALKVGETRLADFIKARRLTPAQAEVARRNFYADPRIKKLREARQTGNGGWKVERIDD